MFVDMFQKAYSILLQFCAIAKYYPYGKVLPANVPQGNIPMSDKPKKYKTSVAKKWRPASPVARYACPFFGFVFIGPSKEIMVDSGDAHCAQMGDSGFSICTMLRRVTTPEWHNCALSHGMSNSMTVKLNAIVSVFPREAGIVEGSRGGVAFGEWYEYVLDSETKRPA